MRPGFVFLLIFLLLALLALVYVLVFHAARAGFEAEAQQNTAPAPSESEPNTPEPTQEPEPTPEPEPQPTASTPKKSETLTSLDAIVSYVDGLGINFSDLASYSMDGYFTDVTLKETADAGDEYENETLYIGDSLVLHMQSRSSHARDMVLAAASINPEDACTKKLVTLHDGVTEATFAEAAAEKNPARIVVTIGTNSMWMEPQNYLYFFDKFIGLLQTACPNAEIILQTTPPLTAAYDAGHNFPTNDKINRFNFYLAGLASYKGIWFLNSAKDLKGADGTLKAQYDNADGYHVTAEAYDIWIQDLRTHATTLQK